MKVRRCGTIGIAGRPNTGKSSLLNRLIGEKLSIVSAKPQTTRHLITGILTREDCQYIFVDAPGQQTRSRSVLHRALNRRATEAARDADVALFVVEVLRAALPEGPAAYPPDQLTDRDERFFAAELLREKLFEELAEELPYRCEVMIESFKEEGRLRRIEATILVERESQKLIVLGARGERLKRMASAARQDMERLFEGKVYLGVWVKVRRAWTDDARVLRQLGYE